MYKLHILTLTWNKIDYLEKLRPGLARNLSIVTMKDGVLKDGWYYPEWYIRDNGSKDNTVETVNGWQYLSNVLLPTTIFPIGHNRDNFSQGVNYLFEKANPKDDDLILLLNNDIEFGDDTSLLNMVNLMTPDVGIVGARLLYPNSNKLQHAGVIFSERYGNMPWHYRRGEESDLNACKNRYFQAVTAACCLVRASDFRKVGGFDERYFWAFDDINFSLMIGKNKKIAYCGSTNIYHFESASLNKNPVNTMYLNSNVKLFKDTWFGKYEIDHNKYINNNLYNEIKVK